MPVAVGELTRYELLPDGTYKACTATLSRSAPAHSALLKDYFVLPSVVLRNLLGVVWY